MADIIPLTIRCHRAISRSHHSLLLPITLIHHHMTHTTTGPTPPSPTTTKNYHPNNNYHYNYNHHNPQPPTKPTMANSKYEYTRNFETPHPLLPNTYIILRLDGRSFTNFTQTHNFQKPNDPRALHLMNASATATLRTLPDITVAFGVSDEFSFLLPRECALFDRREDKLISTVVSTFTGWYVFLWPKYFTASGGGEGEGGEEEEKPLLAPPSFDCRAVCYPSMGNVRDYFAWRQVDTHINNLYNTVFWALVLKGGLSRREADAELKVCLFLSLSFSLSLFCRCEKKQKAKSY